MLFFFFKRKTAYEVRISDWSSDVCSSDLRLRPVSAAAGSPEWIMLAAPKGLTGLWPVRIIGEPKTCELLMVITRFVGCSPDRRAQDASPRHADRSRRYL